MRVTCGVPTKNRHRSLAQTLQSVVFQTYPELDLIIVDDSESPSDLREDPMFQNLFRLMNERKMDWRVIYGPKLGQHICHQIIQDEAKTELIWRIDDDEIAEPNALSLLVENMLDLAAGAVGGLVLTPPSAVLPNNLKTNQIAQPDNNVQWFQHNGAVEAIEVEHLHSSFLYKKGIARYEIGLSPAAHREETLFSYEIKRAGYKLYVIPPARTWHLRAGYGGIRSHQNPQFWVDDEKLFQTKLAEWGVTQEKTKVCVLDCGKGDHIVFKSILPLLRAKGYKRIIVASCYDDVFKGWDVELISIADAIARYGNIDRFNIYRWCIDHNWKESLGKAFEGMYLQ
jgi:glycosyltransferase involved in cell wall biosynthesis